VLGALSRSASSVITAGSGAVAATLGRLRVREATAGYLGLEFLMTMIVIALMAGTQMVAMRDEEASGRLDNLLVRPVPRVAWLAGRLGVSLALVLLRVWRPACSPGWAPPTSTPAWVRTSWSRPD
jgi:putative exporter of polyketide antibiotics